MKLSDAHCRNARSTGVPYKLADGHGLYLYVAANGSRLWRMDYAFDGKRKTLSLGSYPIVSLSDVRVAHEAARRHLANGRNPAVEKRLAKASAELARANTFGIIADELLAKLEREKKAGVTIDKRRWLLKDLAGALADRPIAEITPVEILGVLREVEGRGHLETARRLRAAIGQVMRLAVATGRAQNDPTPALRGAIATPTTTHRAAITDPEGARRLMAAIDAYDRPVVRAAMLIMAYCFPRPGECRLARWTELDLERAVWTIPAERMKMRREHKIPLSRQAVAVFTDLKGRTAYWPDSLCFPGQRGRDRPISENTICAALRSLGFAKDEMSAHGFRALASTLLHERSEFSTDAIERSLAHQDVNPIRRAYARGQHWDERVKLVQWWADYLDGLVAPDNLAAAQPEMRTAAGAQPD
jgi:integrase